ncbi:hypothetical protein ONE63_009517 [Megalurothrips usitatus]|uniref:Insulin-like domain-containing protein n=1 Tax=Megalurothrips usitatus TaxID=439358 RepID=A0AAV7XRN8_9NEOP|nr:hypothetical protein ONE63_009517 [Megalurothrips usitatus]
MQPSTMILVVLVQALVMEAHAKDPCSKDWLRFMLVQSCGMDKRHLQRKKPSVGPSLKKILGELDEEFDNWQMGIPSTFDDDYPVTTGPTSTTAADVRDKEPEARNKTPAVDKPAKGVFMRLFEHPMQLLSESWMGLVLSEPKEMPRRRAIQNAISRCCSESCDEDAFANIC